MCKKTNFSDFDHIPTSDVFDDIRKNKSEISDLKYMIKQREEFVKLLIGIIKHRRNKK